MILSLFVFCISFSKAASLPHVTSLRTASVWEVTKPLANFLCRGRLITVTIDVGKSRDHETTSQKELATKSPEMETNWFYWISYQKKGKVWPYDPKSQANCALFCICYRRDIRAGPLKKWWGMGKETKKNHARENAKKKNSCKEKDIKVKKKNHAEGRSNCDFYFIWNLPVSIKNNSYSKYSWGLTPGPAI